MINKLELLIEEIMRYINKDEIKNHIKFNEYVKNVLTYKNDVDEETRKETYEVMLFEVIYINILMVVITEYIKYKYLIEIDSNDLLNKIDTNSIFSDYVLKNEYKQKIRNLVNKEQSINLSFFSNFYEKSLNKKHKKLLGQFYTPQTIVTKMVKQLEIVEDAKIIDPACGAGIFITEIIDAYSRKVEEKQLLSFIQNNLYANDINPFAIIMTKINIIIKIINIIEDKESIEVFFNNDNLLENVKLKDTLKENEKFKYDIIIGNPPFFKMDNKQLKNYELYTCKTYGQPNIYELFMYWALENIKEEGFIKYIIPQSFKAGLYFKTLRQELSKKYIDLIINIENTKKLFCEVEQAVLIISIKNIPPKNRKTTIIYFDAIKNEITNQYKVLNKRIFNNTDDSYEIYIAKKESEYGILKNINSNKNLKTLNKLGYKFANGLFVWNQNKDIITNDKIDNTIPVIYGDYIERYNFNYDSQIKNSEKGIYCQIGEKTDRFKLSGKKLIIQRTSTLTKKDRLNACVITDKFVNKYDEYLLENHVNFLSKIESKSEQIDEDLLYFFLAIINSDLTNWIFSVKSGNTQISATELNLLPICPYKKEIAELSKEYCNNYTQNVELELNNTIYREYGLTNDEIGVIQERRNENGN